MHKNLIISVVGDDSLHCSWIDNPDIRTFDLCLVYYGSNAGLYCDDADLYFERQGIKFSLIHQLAESELAQTLASYDRVWLPDDDIECSTQQINRLFQLAEQYQLQIAQPAIGRGDVTYEALRHHPGYLLRYTHFVEMMCPLFTLNAFSRALPTFSENVSGWGLDWVWSWSHARDQVAVIDAVAVDHSRPLGSGGVHQSLAEMGIDPEKEFRAMVAKYPIHNRRWQKGIRRDTLRLKSVAELNQPAKRLRWRNLWPSLRGKQTPESFLGGAL